MRRVALAFLLSSALATAAAAQLVPPQNSKPEPTPKVDTIPMARDVPFPGTMQLTVDTTDNVRGIFHIHQHVPVPAAGDFVMLYPQWVPGGHNPRNDIKSVTGFRPSANGRPLKWVRDNLNVYAFHITIPQGVSAIDLDYDYVTPTDGNQGRILATERVESIRNLTNERVQNLLNRRAVEQEVDAAEYLKRLTGEK